MAPGRAGAEGNVEIELTPEKWTALLPSFAQLYSTAGPDGAGVYTHVWRAAQIADLKTHTFIRKTGEFRNVFRGAVIDSFALAVQLDQLIRATMAVAARNDWMYDENAVGGPTDEYVLLASAAMDDNIPLAFVGGEIQVDAATVEDIQGININFRNNFDEKRGIRRNRGVMAHNAGEFRIEISGDMYFSNEVMLRKFMADIGLKFPFEAGMDLTDIALAVNLAGTGGAGVQEFKFNFPRVQFDNVEDPIQGPGSIMLRFTGAALPDASVDGNFELTAYTTEAASWFAGDAVNNIVVQPL